MGQGKLSDDFTAEVKAVKEGFVALELTPKSAAAGVDKLRFVVSTTDWKVQEAVLYDPLGNRNRLVFSGAKWNSNLPDAGFVFAPPAGAREIKAPGR
jgi:outer membrane lipoprotein-sorting protein